MSERVTLPDRLRHHVISRNGVSKDADGNPVVPNGAWAMMLEAADVLEALAPEHPAVAMLRRCQWDEFGKCPECLQHDLQGHARDCALAKLICTGGGKYD